MPDLNALKMFEQVAALKSFSTAAKKMGLPKSTLSRSVRKLEAELKVQLIQRTTRHVSLTPSGKVLFETCGELLNQMAEALDHVGGLDRKPRGLLKVSCGIGFGINVVAEHLPEFLRQYPELKVSLELKSKLGNPIVDGTDIAICLGPLPDSGLVSVPLGSMKRYLCASPAYLKRRGKPKRIEDLSHHDTIEMPRGDGRPRRWSFSNGEEIKSIEVQPLVTINDALAIHKMILHGAGIGIVSSYIAAPDLKAKRLVRLFPEWTAPAIEINLLFPSKREVSPNIRVFVQFMKTLAGAKAPWLRDH